MTDHPSNAADGLNSAAASTDERETRSTSPAKRKMSEMDSDACPPLLSDEMELDKTDTPQTEKSESPASANQSSATEIEDEAPPVVVPSLDEQVGQVRTLATEFEEKEGVPGYLISRKWLGRVIARSKYSEEMGPFDKSCLEGEIGPINNGDIVPDSPTLGLVDEKGLEFVQVKKGLRISDEYEIFPQPVWQQIDKWYGLKSEQKPIIRYHHQVNTDAEIPEWQFEVYPPIFTLRRYHKKERPGEDGQAPQILASRYQKFNDFIKAIKEKLGIPLTTKINIHRILEVQGTTEAAPIVEMHSMPTPAASREASPAPASVQSMWIGNEEYEDLSSKSQIDELPVKDESMNANYNGSSRLHTFGLTVDQTLIIIEGAPKAGGGTIKRVAAKNLTIGKDPVSEASSGRASPAFGIMTRGRNRNTGRTKGTVGLVNLGNTCYMNSALQCIRACKELTLFFLGNSWKRDLNADNPLGHKGQIATVYAELLKNLYNGSPGAFTPRQFKSTLGRFAPLFSGYGQQDSQEFMSFLVDGLHEDLNRIRQKPYISNPDFDDSKIDDPEAIKELGEIYKNNYRLRNSSVITDLFNGFYKNKLVCPVCHKVSITFDPYLLLTLQLPMDHHWQFPFTFVPLNGKPIRINIDNEKGQSMKSLKEFVASRISDVSPEKMIMVEIFSNKFYRVMKDAESIAEANIQARDDMVIYQLEDAPTNYPPPKRKIRSMLDVDKPEEPEAPPKDERQLVAVLHRVKNKGYTHSSNSVVLWPNFITLSKEEASDYNEIMRKCLRLAQNTSTRSFSDLLAHKDDSDMESQPPPDYDQIAEDGDASTDEKSENVKTRSLDSEDGFVDVEMTGTEEPTPEQSTPIDFWEKGSEIPSPLNELFNICVGPYNGVVPIGFQNHFDMSGNYPSIKERIPRSPVESEESEQASESQEAADESEDAEDAASEGVPERSEAEVSYYHGEEGTEEMSSITVKPGAGRNRKNRQKKFKNKQNKFANKQKFAAKRPANLKLELSDDPDDPRLVRPNEVILLDWDPVAYRELFEKPFGDARKEPEEFDDPVLAKKKSQRDARKKRGVSLDDCFEETSKEEILTQDNAWYCDRCKEHRLASKKLEVWTIPDILVIHLKRFSSSRAFRDKIDILVDFPTEGLDLTGKVGVDEGKDLVYDLFAVDNHYGGLGGGHYTAYGKNFYDDQWYDFNDSHVSKAGNVCTPAAYLLFYRRRSAHPLGSPEIQRIVEKLMDGAATDSEDAGTSRDASPSEHDKSGNGKRLGDSYPSGSSNALVGPVAARPLQGVGSAGAGPQARQGRGKMQARQQKGATLGTRSAADDVEADELSEIHQDGIQESGLRHRSGGLDDDDEGIGLSMDEEYDDDEGHPFRHGGGGGIGGMFSMGGPSWSFSQLQSSGHGHAADEEDADGDDFGSNGAENGSDDGLGAEPMSHGMFSYDDEEGHAPAMGMLSAGFGQHPGYSAGHSSPMEQSPIVQSVEKDAEGEGVSEDELTLEHLKND